MPLFAGLTERQLGEVAGTVTERRVKPGKAVIKEGHWGHEFVLVLHGEVDVVRDGTVVATLTPGSHVGEVAVLDGVRRNATVVARTEAVVGAIDSRLFEALLDDIPVLAARISSQATVRRP
jgi:CRP-like cAMP-binding protein